MTSNLTEIKGIGDSILKKLKKANIKNLDDLAKSTIDYLTKIDGVGEKSAKKWIFAAKEFLNSHGISKKIKVKDYALEQKVETKAMVFSEEIYSIQSEIKKIHNRIDNMDYRLKNIENNFYKSKNIEKSIPKITEEHFLRTLRVVYDSLEKKIENFVPISALTEKLKEYIPWSTEKIHSEIYKLFMNYKVDLQPGKRFDGKPLVQDGRKFVWFKFKS